jgi:hypothetical protein
MVKDLGGKFKKSLTKTKKAANIAALITNNGQAESREQDFI